MTIQRSPSFLFTTGQYLESIVYHRLFNQFPLMAICVVSETILSPAVNPTAQPQENSIAPLASVRGRKWQWWTARLEVFAKEYALPTYWDLQRRFPTQGIYIKPMKVPMRKSKSSIFQTQNTQSGKDSYPLTPPPSTLFSQCGREDGTEAVEVNQIPFFPFFCLPVLPQCDSMIDHPNWNT